MDIGPVGERIALSNRPSPPSPKLNETRPGYIPGFVCNGSAYFNRQAATILLFEVPTIASLGLGWGGLGWLGLGGVSIHGLFGEIWVWLISFPHTPPLKKLTQIGLSPQGVQKLDQPVAPTTNKWTNGCCVSPVLSVFYPLAKPLLGKSGMLVLFCADLGVLSTSSTTA